MNMVLAEDAHGKLTAKELPLGYTGKETNITNTSALKSNIKRLKI